MGSETRERTRKKTSLTWGTALATALAAITTSLVSTQLTGVLNSILLAGVISVVSAVAGEIYRNVISTTTEKTKELLGDHIELSADAEEVAKTDPAEAEVLEGAATAAEEEAEEAKSEARTERARHRAEEEQVPWPARVVNYFRHHKYMQYVLLFSLVIVLTSAINYMLFPDTVDSYHYRTTVQKQELTEEQRQLIVEDILGTIAAQNEAASEGTQTDPNQTPTASTEGTQTSEAQLSQQVTDLQATVAELQKSLETQNAEYQDLLQRLTDLEARLPAETP